MKIYFMVLFIVYISSMVSMDFQKDDVLYKAITFLATDGVRFLNHDMITSLAVNKKYEKMLLDTASYRKKHMTGLMKKLCIHPLRTGVWHKHGSMYSDFSIFFQGSGYFENTLCISCCCLKKNNGIGTKMGLWKHFEKELKYKKDPIRLHITDEEKCCLYGWSNGGSGGWENAQLKRYVLSKTGDREDKNCVLRLEDGELHTFFYFLSDPYTVFINAFLKSPVAVCTDTFNAYQLSQITLPQSYEYYKKYGLFDALPELLHAALKQRYVEQKNER